MQNRDSYYYIQQRQEGKDILSWIERFGLHLICKKSKPIINFSEGDEHVLILRIKANERDDFISAYQCRFNTGGNGLTRFYVDDTKDEVTNSLKELMVDKAEWNSVSTIAYWKEVFRAGDW